VETQLSRVNRTLREVVRQVDCAIGTLGAGEGYSPAPFELILLMTLVDLFGSLTFGLASRKATTENASRFLREYVGSCNPRYCEIGDLLYHMLRHGMVHEQKWKSLLLQDGMELRLRVTKGLPQEHLSAALQSESAGLERVIWLNVDVPSLLADVNQGIEAVFKKMERDEGALSTCIAVLDKLISSENERDLPDRLKKQLAYVRKQASPL
jgi:hypothetical protein